MPDDLILIRLERTDADWTAHAQRERGLLAGAQPLGPTVTADSPGGALEQTGRLLDELEARRLSELAQLSDADRDALADVADVLEVLAQADGELGAGDVAIRAGWARNDGDAYVLGLDVVQRAHRALEHAQRDGLAQSRRSSGYAEDNIAGGSLLWSLHPRAREETGR